MIEKPMLFSAPMIRALLAGTKTQTRRTVKWPDWLHYGDDHAYAAAVLSYPGGILRHNDGREFRAPHPVGSGIWARETFAIEHQVDDNKPPHNDGRPIRYLCDGIPVSSGDDGTWEQPHYRATDPTPELAYDDTDGEPTVKWRPSIFMPRWASRITLEVTGVRVERVAEISEADALAEGILRTRDGGYAYDAEGRGYHGADPRISYMHLWDSINGAGAWDANPWVWVYEFRRVNP